MNQSRIETTIGRRKVVAGLGVGVLVAALAPRLAVAKMKDVENAMKKLIGDKKPKEGRVKLELPQIAENGNTVPIKVSVEGPMTETDYVKAVHVFSEGNPRPDVASFYFTPRSGKAFVSTRMRMAKTQNIIAVAETNKGEVFMAKQGVKVTIGGCGG